MSISVSLQLNKFPNLYLHLSLLYISFFSVTGAVVMYDEYGESMSVIATEAGRIMRKLGGQAQQPLTK